jgi:hypothetical protein
VIVIYCVWPRPARILAGFKIGCLNKYVRMFEHMTAGQKNIGSLETPLFNVDIISKLVTSIKPDIVFHRPIANIVHEPFPEQ